MPSLACTYLITGTSRGLGLEMVRQLLDVGATVVATCRNPGKATHLNELHASAAGKDCLTILPMDVTDDASIASATKSVSFSHPQGIDILIHNAGISLKEEGSKALLDTSRHVLRSNLETNAISPIMVTRHFLPLLERAPNPGNKLISMITSGLGSTTKNLGTDVPYGISKTALNKVIVELSLELRSKNIPVTGMDPGWVNTDMGRALGFPPLQPKESVRGILNLISRPPEELNGQFYLYSGRKISL
ncbi:MAG: hypothetical protein DHS80DRAFT_12234 [Piptocephalis tieghemiana]|nr:MAG: hypothetical protein DHS80DRAFT_12234 [Piptocephalis tieghemiana]